MQKSTATPTKAYDGTATKALPVVVFALALTDSTTSDVLRPGREKEYIQICEEYSNGSIDLVQSWIDRFADVDAETAVWRGLRTIGMVSWRMSAPTPPRALNKLRGLQAF